MKYQDGGFDEKGRAVYAALTGAYRYAMQEVFAIPIVDEVKNDNSLNNENVIEKDSIKEDDNSQTDNIETSIEEMNIEDIDSLFDYEKTA